MKAIKATFVQDDQYYAVQFEDGSFEHAQPKSEISIEKYKKLILRNFPQYNFSVIEDAEIVLDEGTASGTTETQETINQLKQQEEMEAQTQPKPRAQRKPRAKKQTINNSKQPEMKVEQPATPVAQPSITSRAGRGLAVGTAFTVKCVTRPTITTLLFAADVLLQAANAVAYVESVAIKPLNIHPDATRRELQVQAVKSCDAALQTVYSIPKGTIQVFKTVSLIKQMSAVQPATS